MLKINPLAKLVLLICWIVVILTNNSTFMFMVYLLIGFISCYKSSMSLKYFRTIIIYLLIFTIVSSFYRNLFFESDNVLFSIGSFNIYLEVMSLSAFLFLRILCLTLFSNAIILSLTSYQFSQAVEKLLTPLEIFKFNPARFAMILMLALKFVPIMGQEFKRVHKAQIVKGKNYNKNFGSKLISFIYLLIPVLFSSFKKADTIALAMDIKGYDATKKRTSYEPNKLDRKNYCFLVIMISISTILVFTF